MDDSWVGLFCAFSIIVVESILEEVIASIHYKKNMIGLETICGS